MTVPTFGQPLLLFMVQHFVTLISAIKESITGLQHTMCPVAEIGHFFHTFFNGHTCGMIARLNQCGVELV